MPLTRRRVLVGATVGSMVAALRCARAADTSRTVTVALVSWFGPSLQARHTDSLREGLRAYGYVEGRNLILLSTFTGGDRERTREAVRADIERHADVLVVTATPAIHIAKEATRTIPIVMAPVADPLATGLVDSLAHPGGNLTGMSMLGPDLSGKRLELLQQIMPSLKSIAFLGSARDANTKTFVAGTKAAAEQLGLHLAVRLIDAPGEIDGALFEQFKRDGAEAVIVQPIFMGSQDSIARAAATAKLPVITDYLVFAEAGALLTYGPDDRAPLRRAAYFVDRILKGARPAELPIEQPTEFVFAINVKTARTLGLSVPQSLIATANQVID
jgi:putative ABC transport system substrate-binding protein